jgi:hypothetical protein
MKKILVVLFCMLVLTVGISAQDKNQEKNTSEVNLIGGWTPYSCNISSEATKIFDTVIKNVEGVKYTPVAVATQLVSGKNYSFFCNANVVAPRSANEAAMVLIYAPLNDSPRLISITPLSHKEKTALELTLVGGWKPYSCDISAETKEVFDKALNGLLGVKYTPVAVATQLVSGKNYSFFCNSNVVAPRSANEAAVILIYAALDKPPHIISITPVLHREANKANTVESTLMPGGWTPYSCNISTETQTVFDTAFKGFVGVKYTPVAVATQVVAGVNYSFFCNAKVVYPNAPDEAAMVLIYAPPNMPPHIISIKRGEL